jgi:hypothetical protein
MPPDPRCPGCGKMPHKGECIGGREMTPEDDERLLGWVVPKRTVHGVMLTNERRAEIERAAYSRGLEDAAKIAEDATDLGYRGGADKWAIAAAIRSRMEGK